MPSGDLGARTGGFARDQAPAVDPGTDVHRLPDDEPTEASFEFLDGVLKWAKKTP